MIFLIHHLGVMLQAPVITSRIGRYLNRAIGAYTQLRRVAGPSDPEAEQLRARVAAEGQPATAGKAGYVDAVDGRRLVRVAQQHDVVHDLGAAPGPGPGDQRSPLVDPGHHDLDGRLSALAA